MAYGGHTHSAFATFMILCRKSSQLIFPLPLGSIYSPRSAATSFFLGILFSLFPYDYPLLWRPGDVPASAFDALETHLKVLHNSPLLIPRILHTVVGIGLTGFFIKLYKPSESNALFDGASLVMYMIGVIIYIANIVKGMRMVTDGTYGSEIPEGGETVIGLGVVVEESKPLGREDSLKVLSASNTILALVLAGVLALQAGQWYAERKQSQEMEQAEREKDIKKHDSGRQHGKKKQ